jgi:hypothetical protein
MAGNGFERAVTPGWLASLYGGSNVRHVGTGFPVARRRQKRAARAALLFAASLSDKNKPNRPDSAQPAKAAGITSLLPCR